jgi:signal transduction histidine kinase
MKRHLIIILLLVVTLPLLALWWMGHQRLDSELGMIQARFNKMLTQNIQKVDNDILKSIEHLQEDMQNYFLSAPPGEEKLLAAKSKFGFINQIIAIDINTGIRIFPVEDSRQVTGLEEAAREISMLHGGKAADYGDGLVKPENGWYVSEGDDGTSLIYWDKDSSGNVILAKLAEDVFLKYVVEHVASFSNKFVKERLVFSDQNGKLIYEWGSMSETMSALPQVAKPLSFPVSHIKLKYYAEPIPDLKESLKFQLILQLGAMGFILFFLGIYIYDAMHEADKKVSFVNQVSHELKTPLTNIRMYAELLGQSLAGDDEQTEHKLRIIESESQRLSRLINNVLTLSHSKDNMQLKLTKNNVDALINKVVDSFRPSLEQLEMEIKLDLRGGTSMFDKDSMEQILINLISNVEKYAADGKFLAISAWKEGNELHVQVKDKGIGIPSQMKERIFNPFFRVHDSITEGVGGAGIGLSLARDLARQNGGDLILIEQDKGACFEVII